MRHRSKKVTLGRTRGPRTALLTQLAEQVIVYEKVKTTEAKAKAVKPLVERLITRGKTQSLAAKREAARVVGSSKALRKLFEVIGPRYATRAGGYCRIVKLGTRQGDRAPIVYIELV